MGATSSASQPRARGTWPGSCTSPPSPSPCSLGVLEDEARRPVTRRTLSDPIPSAAWAHLPTTVLIGERDAFNGPEPWTRARERVQDVRVVDCDHFLPFNLPGLVADVILEPPPLPHLAHPSAPAAGSPC